MNLKPKLEQILNNQFDLEILMKRKEIQSIKEELSRTNYLIRLLTSFKNIETNLKIHEYPIELDLLDFETPLEIPKVTPEIETLDYEIESEEQISDDNVSKPLKNELKTTRNELRGSRFYIKRGLVVGNTSKYLNDNKNQYKWVVYLSSTDRNVFYK